VKLIALAGLLSLSGCLWVLVVTPPASGYEISVYASLPWPFWILIAVSTLSLFCALLVGKPVCVQDIPVLVPSAFASLTSVLVLLLIPYFRGYTLYGAGDVLTNLGGVRDLLQVGHVSSLDVYPAIHVFEAALTYTTSISPIRWTFFLPPLFFLALVLGTFLLARQLGSTNAALFASSLLIIPVLGAEATRESILPSFDAFCMTPLALYLLLKTQRSVPYTVAFVLVLGVVTLLHVEASLFLWFFFIAALLVAAYVSRHAEIVRVLEMGFGTSGPARRRYLAAIAIVGVFAIAFFSSLVAFGNTVRTIYGSISSSLFEGPIATLGPPRVTTGIIPITELLIQEYGAEFVYIGLATGLTAATAAKVVTKRQRVAAEALLLSSLLSASLVIGLIFLLYGLIIGFTITRFMKYPFLASALILGAYFVTASADTSLPDVSVAEGGLSGHMQNRDFVPKAKMVSARKSAVAILVVAAAIICVFNTYPTLSSHEFSHQITKADFAAMEFFFQHRDDRYLISEVLPLNYQTRFAQEFYGIDAAVPSLRNGYEPDVLPPSHFGYDRGQFLGAAYSGNTYLLEPSLSRMYYPNLYPGLQQFWRYTPTDFQMLNRDPTVDQIYDNGGVQILEVLANG